MRDVNVHCVSYGHGDRRIEQRRIGCHTLADVIRQRGGQSIHCITESQLTVGVAGHVSTARFAADSYGQGAFLEANADDARGRLVTAWSPTKPLYRYEVADQAAHIFSDDLSLLRWIADLFGERCEPDELFAVWTLTGLPAAQFGLTPMRTPWQSIRQVPAGVEIRTSSSAWVLTRAEGAFWDVDLVSSRQARRDVRETFIRSVAKCTDDRSAVLASGGIDSSAVAGACRALGHRPVLITNTYPDAPETDESHYVAALASAWDLPRLSLVARRASLLLHATVRQARPFMGLFRADDQNVIEHSKSLGATTVLDGLGGDELFAVRD